jgi:hypothetical protein
MDDDPFAIRSIEMTAQHVRRSRNATADFST